MLKLIPPNSYQFGELPVQRVKFSSRGLIGQDLDDLIKRAGHEFVRELDQVQLHPGEVPVHFIALGATEGFGVNRNFDGFGATTCERDHGTFAKYGRVFRNHKNKDRTRSYGRIIKSAYNQRMKRIELLAGLNATEQVAERNGGRLADQEMAALEKEGTFPSSMASKIPYDVCLACGQKARTRDDYCTEDDCAYGGCRYNMGKVADDGTILARDNPFNCWFDISHVPRGADRTSFALGILTKAAEYANGGAYLAEQLGLSVPAYLLISGQTDEKIAVQAQLLAQLAQAERQLETEPQHKLGYTFADGIRAPVGHCPTIHNSPTKLASLLRALVDERSLLSPRDFLGLMLGEKYAADDAILPMTAQLPGVFSRLTNTDDLETQLRDNPYRPATTLPSLSDRLWAGKLASDYSLAEPYVTDRIHAAILRNCPLPVARTKTATMIKSAAEQDGAEQLARHYALYQLAFLDAVRDRAPQDVPRTITLLARHNAVI